MENLEEKDRLKIIRKSFGDNQDVFSEKLGITRDVLSNYETGRSDIPFLIYTKIHKLGFNIDWLKTGEGDMRIEDKPSIINNPTEAKKKGLIPYYDIDVTAHIAEVFTELNHSVPAYWLDIPHFKNCIACRVSGDSMSPEISSGDMILVKKIHNPDVILWGEIYLVVTDESSNNLCTIKKLYKGNTPDTFILRAINPEYSGDTVILKTSIITIAHVIGCVKMF